MSLRTCSWLLPQKEQRYGTLGPLPLLLVEVTCPLGSLACLFALAGFLRFGRRRGLGFLHGLFGDLLVVVLRGQRIPLLRVHRVDDAIVLGGLGRHEKVPV